MPDLRADARERAHERAKTFVFAFQATTDEEREFPVDALCEVVTDAATGPLIARIHELEAVLRQVEWGCNGDDGHSGCLACPKCGAVDYNDHHADCALHAALTKGEGS